MVTSQRGEGARQSLTPSAQRLFGCQLLTDLSEADLHHELAQIGQPRYRADQIMAALYVELAESFQAITTLPRDLRIELAKRWRFPGLHPIEEVQSKDGRTAKVLFELCDGETIESVLMRYERRNSVCVSTQVGCPIGCTFCATGQSGYRRNLSSGEIVEQVLFFARALRGKGERVTHVVFMGMGEPFLNTENTLRAVQILNAPHGFNLGARRMTISTAGYVPGIDRLKEFPLQVNLSISLHAPDDSLRTRLVPLNRRYPISEVMAAVRRYIVETGRRVTFEYVLIDGVNDSPEQAQALARLLEGLLCHVNLIPLNRINDGPEAPLRPSPRMRVNAFREILEAHHIPATIRVGRGTEIRAGCGQLRSRHNAAVCEEDEHAD